MRIKIIAPLIPRKHARRFESGDYWVMKELENEFIKRGYEIVKEDADLDFYLFGYFAFEHNLTAPRRMCWVYSHPNSIKSSKWKEFSKQFEHIFVLSNTLKVDNSSVLLGASSKEFVKRKKEPEYDIIFVGNSGKPERVELMSYLISLDKYKICIAGGGWAHRLGKLIEKVDYKGRYIKNEKLSEFFNQGKLSFYSAHEDMRREGFVAVRILDIFRGSDNLCISDDNHGLKDIFRFIPKYRDKEDLVFAIDFYLSNPLIVDTITRKCREDVQQWTFEKTVTEIERWIKKEG